MKLHLVITVANARRLVGLIGVLLVLGVLPNQASAQLLTCSEANPEADSDGDGFTNGQECSGITTGGSSPVFIPPCNGILPRNQCLDLNTKDLFVFYVPAGTGGLLGGSLATSVPDPFVPLNLYGLAFNGLTDLAVTTHKLGGGQITVSEIGIATRTVTSVSPQKGLIVVEDLDISGPTLGYCQYGTPNGPDEEVCTIYTRRIMDYITTTCSGLTIRTAGGATSTAAEVFKAYAVETILHEIGHALGGLTNKYVSRNGGYHYSSGTIMEQFVTVSTKAGACKFAISNGWNLAADPASVRLK
jgi:hypothetical protein